MGFQYKLYNPAKPNNPQIAQQLGRGSLHVFDNYTLYNRDQFLQDGKQWTAVPKVGIILDDFMILEAFNHFSKRDVATYFPGDFASEGIPRARRLPQGSPACLYVKIGDLDADGVPATKEGLYNVWLYGIHELCGREGIAKWLIRPSFEKRGKRLTFRVGRMAKNQYLGGAQVTRADGSTTGHDFISASRAGEYHTPPDKD